MMKIDEILSRLQEQQTDVSNPDELTDRIMDSLPDLATEQPKPARRIRLYIVSAIAAAASVLLLLTLTLHRSDLREAPPTTASIVSPASTVLGGSAAEGKAAAASQEAAPPQPAPDPNCHYASTVPDGSAVGTNAPSRVDDFIAKLAEYNHVRGEALGCAAGDSAMRSVAYVFPDNDRIRLFDRLLQVACCYDCNTPGYQLTISQQQLLFSLEDPKEGLRYLYLAERISGGRIILYAARSPIGRSVSSECYLDFRENITHTNQTLEL